MEYLEFQNPIFIPYTNTTVRYGLKWSELVKPGDIVRIPEGLAEITQVLVTTLARIPWAFLEREHDPVCRTLSGLKMVLAGVYPAFAEEEGEAQKMTLVTVLEFIPYRQI